MAGCYANRAAHPGVETALQQTGWNRRYDFAGRPLSRAATVAISRAFQDSFAKHSGRMRHQSSTVDGLLVGCASSCYTHIRLRPNWRMGRVTDFANSIQIGNEPHRIYTISRSPVSRFNRTIGWNVCGATFQLGPKSGMTGPWIANNSAIFCLSERLAYSSADRYTCSSGGWK
jgi:hypothetical protein